MTEEHSSILRQLEPLELLDLSKRHTVSEIVDGMKRCSFGARRLGEMAEKVTEMAASGRRPYLVSDIARDSPIRPLLQELGKKYFRGPYTTSGFLHATRGKTVEEAVLVNQAEYDATKVYGRCGKILCINDKGTFPPGKVNDGYFPDVMMDDPQVALPILKLTLEERLEDKRHPVSDLMQQFEELGGEAKATVHGAHTLSKMLSDKSCTVVLSLSGAMTIAKMQLLVDDLIQTGRLSCIASTGALMAHGLIEGSGCRHYKYDPRFSDEELAAEGLNRVTDTIEPESNFDHIEEIVATVIGMYSGDQPIGTHQFHRDLGAYLADHHPEARAILLSAFRRKVPIIVPACTDSELGNDILVINEKRLAHQLKRVDIVSELDTRLAFEISRSAERMGIFTIGGGVPRNWLQNLKPLEEIRNARMGIKDAIRPYFYGCRIDPAQMHLGHLSGCTYREGGSWRKFDFKGQLAEVRQDATVVWPFVQKFALERYAQAA